LVSSYEEFYELLNDYIFNQELVTTFLLDDNSPQPAELTVGKIPLNEED
jgi:hypothetical protein